MPNARRIRLASDYGGAALWDDEGATSPEELGLSEGLALDISAWQRLFERFSDDEYGWTVSTKERDYCAAVPALAQRIADELVGRFDVEAIIEAHGIAQRTVYVGRVR